MLGQRDYNRSIGLANMRPSNAVDLYYGNAYLGRKDLDGAEYTNRYHLSQESLRLLQLCQDANGILQYNQTTYRRIARSMEESALFAIDLLGAKIEQGIDHIWGKGLRPSVFNLGLWLHTGSVEPKNVWSGIYLAKAYNSTQYTAAGYDNGIAMVEAIAQAASELGISLPAYNAYNRTSNSRTDERRLFECRPHGFYAQEVGTYIVYHDNSSCGEPMDRDEYFDKYNLPKPDPSIK